MLKICINIRVFLVHVFKLVISSVASLKLLGVLQRVLAKIYRIKKMLTLKTNTCFVLEVNFLNLHVLSERVIPKLY